MTTTDDTTTRGGMPYSDPFASGVSQLRATLAGLAQVPAWTLSEEAVQDRLTDLLRVRAQVEEVTARLLSSVAGREIPRISGASSTRAWLMATRGLSIQDASRLVRESFFGGQVDGTDPESSRSALTRGAWAAGGVSAEQAVLIGATIDRLSDAVPLDAVVSLQGDLIRHAQTLSFSQLQQVCRHAVEVIDPDGADAALAKQLETEEARALALTELKFRRSGDGWTGFNGRIPDAQAAMWRRSLEAFTSPRHERAVAPSPDDATRGGLGNSDDDVQGPTYPQRLGRALLELIEHLPTTQLPQLGANTSNVVITMTLDQLRSGLGEGMLDTGTPMSPGQVRRIACNAQLVPAVLGANSALLDLGLAQRLYDRYQRLALGVRDRGCIWPGCERPSSWCEAHHIIFWTDGGPTDLANGCLLCPYHHHLIHSSAGWQIRLATDGAPEVIPPARIDPARHPRRHERFRPRQC